MDLSDASPFHHSHDGDDEDTTSDDEVAAISNRSSPIPANLDLPTSSLGESSEGEDPLQEVDHKVNETHAPADHSQRSTPADENPEDGDDEDDDEIAFAAEAAANAVEEADAEQERLDQAFLRCRICGQGILEGRPLLRFYPTEPNLLLTPAQQQHQQMALAKNACSAAGVKSTPLPSALPIVNTFDQDIFLHIFCGKTASILPSVNQPELEILTKAGIKNKHGIGPEVNAALARTRCATIVDLGGSHSNTSGKNNHCKGGRSNANKSSKSSGVKNDSNNPNNINNKHTQEKQFYFVREFEAHLCAVRASHLIMNHHQHQQQQRKHHENSNLSLDSDIESSRQSLLHVNPLDGPGMADSTSSDPGTKRKTRKRKARSNSTPASSSTITTVSKYTRNVAPPMAVTENYSTGNNISNNATIGPLSPMFSYPVAANMSMVSSPLYKGSNNNVDTSSSPTGSSKTMNLHSTTTTTNGNYQQNKMPANFPNLFPGMMIGVGAGSCNGPPNPQQSFQSLVFPSRQTQQLLQQQQQFFFGANMNSIQNLPGQTTMHQQSQTTPMMQANPIPPQLTATTTITGTSPGIPDATATNNLSTGNISESPFELGSILSGDNNEVMNSPCSSAKTPSPVPTVAATSKATSGKG